MCCLAFDTVPSKLHRNTFWEVTYDDIKSKVKLHIGSQQAQTVQQFQTLSKIVSMAFGSDPKAAREAELAKIPKPQSAEELQVHFAKVFG